MTLYLKIRFFNLEVAFDFKKDKKEPVTPKVMKLFAFFGILNFLTGVSISVSDMVYFLNSEIETLQYVASILNSMLS